MKRFLLITIFLISSFFICRFVIAVDTVFISQTLTSAAPQCSFLGGMFGCSQTITATQNNISRVDSYINVDYSWPSNLYLQICEVSSTNDFVCDDTPVLSDNYEASNKGWYPTVHNWYFSAGYPTTSGHFYLLKYVWSGAEGDFSIEVRTPDPYAGGYLQTNHDFDWTMEVYYSTTYVPPPAYDFKFDYPVYPSGSIYVGSPAVVDYEYKNPNQIWDHLSIVLIDLSYGWSNAIYDTPVASTTTWTLGSTSFMLGNGNYEISAHFCNSGCTSTSSVFQLTSFSVSSSSAVSVNPFGSPPDTATSTDFGILGNFFRDVLVWLFYPTNGLDYFTSVKNNLMLKAPFAYYTSAKTILEGLSISNGTSPSLSIDVAGIGNDLKILNFSDTTTYAGQTAMTMFRNLIKYGLYLFLLIYYFFRIIHIFKAE